MAHGADIHIKAIHERYGPASLRAFRKRGRKAAKKATPSWSEEDEETGHQNISRAHKSNKELQPHHNHHQGQRLNVSVRPGGHQRSHSSATSSAITIASMHHQQRYRQDEDAVMQRHVSNDECAQSSRGGIGRGGRGDAPLDGMDYIKYCQYTALYYACKYRNREVAFDLLMRHVEVRLLVTR